MTIREANPSDRERLVEMALAFLTTTPYGTLMPSNADLLERFVDVVFELGAILVAECRDGTLVGMIALAVVPNLITGEPYVEEVAWWVDPPYRTGTVGPRLLVAAENWVRSRKLSLLKMVAPAGTRVGTYYAHAGYLEVETTYCKRL
jgi:GNAT superfamily N-acetyltransferase